MRRLVRVLPIAVVALALLAACSPRRQARTASSSCSEKGRSEVRNMLERQVDLFVANAHVATLAPGERRVVEFVRPAPNACAPGYTPFTVSYSRDGQQLTYPFVAGPKGTVECPGAYAPR
jgi:hypothetical protein